MSKKDAGEQLRRVYFELFNERNHTRLGVRPVPRYDGGTAPDGRKYTRKWDKWVKLLQDKNLDFREYVSAQFQRGNLITGPEDLFNESMVNAYCDAKKNSHEFEQRWNSQEQILLANIQLRRKLGDNDDRAIRFVLHDRSLNVTPLVRYAFGLLNGYCIDEFKQEAKEQYKQHQCWYDAQVGDRIPKEFRKKC